MSTNDNRPDASFEKLVYEVLRATGKLLPLTPDDVAEAERDLEASPIPLPESLRTVESILKRQAATVRSNLAHHSFTRVEENLARAAREGSQISSHVEELMRNDRLKAEQHLGIDDA